ncbi:MAG: hypothetical protein KGS72_28410 [Cyanobacteria bacterium REEB67]|nr:hypothetical protein [Cyanobacteria bacterium REEB67]
MPELSEFERHQQFIEGKVSRQQPCSEGFAASVAKGFRQIKRIMLQGGTCGHLKYFNDGDGWYSVYVEAGPFAGRSGLYQDGTESCFLDWKDGKTIEIPLP